MGEAKRRKAGGGTRSRRKKGDDGMWKLGLGLLVLVALMAALLYWLTTPTIAPFDDLPKAADDAPPFPSQFDRYGVSIGSADAPVVVREFADYQCGGCARFAESAQRLKKEYIDSGKARMVFFDFPLGRFKNSLPAAEAARCAGDQDAYWPMQQLLFARQSQWANLDDAAAEFTRYAGSLGLDQNLFQRCLRSGRHRDAVEQSRRVAQQLKITQTPTVYVDNVLLTQPGWYQLAGVVERRLAETAR